jgi:hypothetical protein
MMVQQQYQVALRNGAIRGGAQKTVSFKPLFGIFQPAKI